MSTDKMDCEDGLCTSHGDGHRGAVLRVVMKDLRSQFTPDVVRNYCEGARDRYAAYGFSSTPLDTSGTAQGTESTGEKR